MKRFVTTTSLLAIIFMLILMPLSAQNFKGEKQGMGIPDHKNMGEGIMNIPNLTDDQIALIEKEQILHQKKMIEIEYKRDLKMIDLHESMNITPNEKKALSIVEDLGKIEIEMQKIQISHHFAMRKIFTKEQLKYFDFRKNGMGFMKGKGMNNGNFGNRKMAKRDCCNCNK